jgi:CheY-like chemotaxis protein
LDADKKLIDTTLQKPLQNEQIFNVLEKLFDIEKNNRSKNLKFISLKETVGVTHNSFTKFAHVYVLIVEDNLINQKILKGVLGDSGMKIIMANNGQEALDEVKKNKELDLVFMDTNMPTMDGYEATKKIREIYDEKQLPIVAISGVGFQNDLSKMASVGANAYLHKPFQIGELYSAFAMYATEEKSKIKNVNCKLSKYKGNKQILDIQKGISYSHTAIFYKEILHEVLVTLKDSDILMDKWSIQREDDKTKVFISDTVRLAEIIGATSFLKILTEINQLFVFKEGHRLKEYTSLYKKEWDILNKEIEEYLKC